MERAGEEVAFAIGIGMVVTAAFVWWSDPTGRPLGVRRGVRYRHRLAIALQAVRGLVERE